MGVNATEAPAKDNPFRAVLLRSGRLPPVGQDGGTVCGWCGCPRDCMNAEPEAGGSRGRGRQRRPSVRGRGNPLPACGWGSVRAIA